MSVSLSQIRLRAETPAPGPHCHPARRFLCLKVTLGLCCPGALPVGLLTSGL